MQLLKRTEKVILILALILCFLTVYAIHFLPLFDLIEPNTFTYLEPQKYMYPYHADEYAHISSSIALLEEHRINYNPYLDKFSDTREVGFSIIVAILFLSGINPLTLYPLLAPLMLVINAFLLFLLIHKITKNYWMSLATIPFLAVVKSNTNFLGNWFFIPLTFSLSIILLFYIIFFKTLNELETEQKPKLKNLIVLILLFLASLLIYPFSAVVIAFSCFAYLIYRRELLKKHSKTILILGTLFTVAIIFFILIHFRAESLSKSIQKFVSEATFEKGTSVMEYEYSFLEVYGLVPLILAAIGLVSIIKLKELRAISKQLKLFIIWPAIHLLNWLIFTFLKYSILITYQRNLYYLLVSLAPLAGIGFYSILKKLHVKLKLLNTKKTTSIVLISIVTIIILIGCFRNYYKIEPKNFSLQKIMTTEDYDSLKWIETEHGKYNKILANPFLSQAAYAVARQRVVSFMSSNLEGGDVSKYQIFMMMNCNEKLLFIEQEKIDFIITTDPIECESTYYKAKHLSKVYSKESSLVYSII